MQLKLYGKRKRLQKKVVQSFFLILFLLPIAASGQTIRLSFKNSSLESVFKEIENKSAYRFIFTREELNDAKPVSIEISNSIDIILQKIFENQPLSYSMDGIYIVVSKKPVTTAPPGTEFMVRGTVVNENDQPIEGASVQVKGKQLLTTTNYQGQFLIYLSTGATLQVSSVGFKPQEILVRDQNNLKIILPVVVNQLDEAVVMAYGTTTRRLSTSTIGRVSSEDISRQPQPNPLAALQGQVSGLFISQSNGLPGSNYNIQIRGLNSIRQGTQPLIIIDGVPMMLNSLSLGQLNSNNNNIFNSINPADIQSMEVLKDADATAIYGSQGANGVILITTKRATAGKTNLDLSYHTGFGKVSRTLPMLSTPDYLMMRKEAFANDGVTPTISNAADLLTWDTTAYTNWKDVLIGGTARTQNIQASLSGGNNQTSFIFSNSYYNETTVFPGNYPYHRGTTRFSIFHNPHRKLKTSFTAYYSADKKTLPTNDLTSYIFLPPNAPSPYDSMGNLAWTTGIENPMSYLLRNYSAENNNLNVSANLQYGLLENLSINASMGYNSIWLSENLAIPIRALRPSPTATGTAHWATANTRSWVIEPYMEYQKKWNKSRLSVIAGTSWQQRSANGNTFLGTNYTNDDLLGVMAAAGLFSTTNYKSRYSYHAVFGRIIYSLLQRYTINLNFRRDGSSRFGPDNKYSQFSSAGFAYVLSEEKFLKKLSHVISFAKLRASVGSTGNDQIGDYQFLDSWSSSSVYQYGGAPAGVLPTRLFNPSLQWEKVNKLEAGFDLGLYKDRILMSVAAFRNRSKNQLISYRLPATTGFVSIAKNQAAEVQNSGIEFELNTQNIKQKNLSWSTHFNISFIRNKLISYPDLSTSSDRFSFAIGYPLRSSYSIQYTGIDPLTGTYTFHDLDSNGTISSPGDLQLTGVQMYDYFGGITNKIQWKSFELSFLFHFVKQTGRNYLGTLPSIPGTISNQPDFVLNRWTKPGDQTDIQRFTTTASTAAFKAYNTYRTSSALLDDASYIRLRNLYLAWDLPAAAINKIKATSAKFILQGQNLLTFTSYKGADPETQSLTSLPPLRIITVGFQITF